MTPEVTPAVTRALATARDWADRLGAAEANALHLLLALLGEEEGRPRRLFQEQGLAWAAVRDALAQRAGRHEPGAAPEDLLFAARRFAADLSGEKAVATEHLLLAILREDRSSRLAVEELGFGVDRLEAGLRISEAGPIRLDEPLSLAEPAEQLDAGRILDANANRAREALRVVEDYCRFVLDDAFLSNELKHLRHDLAEALGRVSSQLLLEARDTRHDVGTPLRTAREEERGSLLEVAVANLKRLQEAFRCLEEYGKLRSPELGRAVEALRYRAYTLEKAILLGSSARRRLADARLYLLASAPACAASLEWTIKEAAAGGVQIVQLREKNLPDRELLERARKVRLWTRQAKVLFIMNDRPDLARLAQADGVHLGQEELSVKDARKIVGPDALIGVSTHNLDQVRQAILDGVSYLGVGPTFPSETKSFETLPGLEFVKQVAAETTLPAFAIGGVSPENVAQVVTAGLRRAAVGHAVCQADDPRKIAAELRRVLDAERLR